MRLIITLILIFGLAGIGVKTSYQKIYLPELKKLKDVENSLNLVLEELANARKKQEDFQKEKAKGKQMNKMITFFDLRNEIDYQKTADKKTITILTNILEIMHQSKVQLAEIALAPEVAATIPSAQPSSGGNVTPSPAPSPLTQPLAQESSLKKKAIAKAVGRYKNISNLVERFSKMPSLIKIENYDLKAIDQKGLDSLLELKITITVTFLVRD